MEFLRSVQSEQMLEGGLLIEEVWQQYRVVIFLVEDWTCGAGHRRDDPRPVGVCLTARAGFFLFESHEVLCGGVMVV